MRIYITTAKNNIPAPSDEKTADIFFMGDKMSNGNAVSLKVFDIPFLNEFTNIP